MIQDKNDEIKRLEEENESLMQKIQELEDTLKTYNQKVEKILIGKQNQRGELIEV